MNKSLLSLVLAAGLILPAMAAETSQEETNSNAPSLTFEQDLSIGEEIVLTTASSNTLYYKISTQSTSNSTKKLDGYTEFQGNDDIVTATKDSDITTYRFNKKAMFAEVYPSSTGTYQELVLSAFAKDAAGNLSSEALIGVTQGGTVTGVDAITTDDSAVEYYNLQGLRVENPAAGQIVIRRQGNNVTKEILK